MDAEKKTTGEEAEKKTSGEEVPAPGSYQAECCGEEVKLEEGDPFPVCPNEACHHHRPTFWNWLPRHQQHGSSPFGPTIE